MKSVTNTEAKRWCEDRGIVVDPRRFLSFDLPRPPLRLEIKARISESFQIFLARSIAACPDVEEFNGGLLWVREWGVWNQNDEQAGRLLFEKVRADNRTLHEFPATIIQPEEFTPLHALLVAPIVVGWDFFWVPTLGDFILFHSHDSYVDVIPRATSVEQNLRQYFSLIELAPV